VVGSPRLLRLGHALRVGFGFSLARMRPWHCFQFKTAWMNDVAYHHTDTIVVGRYPEINAPRRPDIAAILLNVFNINFGVREPSCARWRARRLRVYDWQAAGLRYRYSPRRMDRIARRA
jgi:hypothetical protein